MNAWKVCWLRQPYCGVLAVAVDAFSLTASIALNGRAQRTGGLRPALVLLRQCELRNCNRNQAADLLMTASGEFAINPESSAAGRGGLNR